MKLSFLLKCEVFFCHFMDCRLIGSCLWMKHSDRHYAQGGIAFARTNNCVSSQLCSY